MEKWDFYAMKRSGHHTVMEWIFNRLNRPIVHYNNARRHETFYFYNVDDPILVTSFEDFEIQQTGDLTFLIIRSFHNWLASRLHSSRTKYPGLYPTDKVIRIYRQHVETKDPGILIIDFDRWYADEGYRLWLCQYLELEEDLIVRDERVHKETCFQDYDVLHRGSQFKNDSEFNELLEHGYAVLGK